MVVDRIEDRSGASAFFSRLLTRWDDQRLRFLVVGDAPQPPVALRHVRYVSCRLSAGLTGEPAIGPLRPRPHLALDPMGGERSEPLDAALDKMCAGWARFAPRDRMRRLDGLARPGWRDELTDALDAALPDIDRLYLPTQSFLGCAGARLCDRRPGLHVVHGIHTDYAGFSAARLAGGAGLPETELDALRDAMEARIAREALGRGDKLVLPSPTAVPRLRARLGAVACPVIGRGVDAPAAIPDRRGRSGPLRVLYAGRLEHDKNLGLLAAAAARVGDVEWWIAGGGTLAAWTGDVMPASTRLLGHLHPGDLARVLDGADIFVHPARHDTFALGVLEAMGHGLPVVTTHEGGPAGWLDPEAALVVPAQADAFADAIRALQDPARRERMSAAARSQALGLRWSDTLDRLSAILLEDGRDGRAEFA